jgi:glycosyltransferase involved in cell wall biosynthesis
MIDTGKGGDVMVVLEALKCGVPVISLRKERLGAMCGEGILYVASGEPQSFGKGMVELYKNEKLRSEMAGAALREAFKFDMGENARGLWEVISGGGHKGAKGPKSSL